MDRSSQQGRDADLKERSFKKGKMMKTWFLACLMMVAPLAFADGHGDLGLEKRQPDTAMNVTSVVLGQEVTSVSAEGDKSARQLAPLCAGRLAGMRTSA